MISGYIFTANGSDALDLIGVQGVRYAAAMADGSGFAAFDSEDEFGIGSAIVSGWTLTVVDPHPDYPPSWPNQPDGPKRHIATGDETFALYAAAERSKVPAPRAGCWVTDGRKLYLLVENGADWNRGVEPIWSSDVVEWRDTRVLA